MACTNDVQRVRNGNKYLLALTLYTSSKQQIVVVINPKMNCWVAIVRDLKLSARLLFHQANLTASTQNKELSVICLILAR